MPTPEPELAPIGEPYHLMTGRLTIPDHPEDYVSFRVGMAGTLEIFDIAVQSERRKGRGKLLFNMLLERVAEINDVRRNGGVGVLLIFAITRWGNTIAQEYYEAMGFRIVGRLHNFYRGDGGRAENGIMYGYDI